MKLTSEQSKAYDGIMKFLKSGKAEHRLLTGFAGTGKSTLIAEIMKSLESSYHCVEVLAFTGRAASVLQNKGIKRARTIHSCIYFPVIFNGNIIRFDKKMGNLEKRVEMENIDCFIIDEASMINEQIYNDLMEIGKPVLFCGDSAQLPPIESKKSSFDLFKKIDFQLITIHRQALDNPIIALSQQVRLTGKITGKSYSDNEHLVLRDKREIMSSKHLKLTQYDVILCGLNKTRLKLNDKFRGLGNHTSDNAEVSEPIMCLRNRNINNKMFYNGERYRVIDRNFVDPEKYLREIAKYSNFIDDSKIYTYTLKSLDTDDDTLYEVNIPNTSFDEVEPKAKGLGYFTFAYAVTVHKSQGSEWDNVGFVREDVSYFCDQRAFDYTAITRAREYLTVYL